MTFLSRVKVPILLASVYSAGLSLCWLFHQTPFTRCDHHEDLTILDVGSGVALAFSVINLFAIFRESETPQRTQEIEGHTNHILPVNYYAMPSAPLEGR